MKKIMQPESSHNSLAQFGRWNNIVFSSIIIVEWSEMEVFTPT